MVVPAPRVMLSPTQATLVAPWAVPVSPDKGADGAAADLETPPPPSPDLAPPMPPAAGECARLFGGGAVTKWAHYDAAGKLVYDPIDERGDRIMDYSSAGYLGGGVA